MGDADEHAWTAWLHALSDPLTPPQITLSGLTDETQWDLGQRVLQDHMLHYVLSGGQEGTVANQRVETQRGMLLWIPPGTRQHLRKRRSFQRLVKYYVRFQTMAPPPSSEPFTIQTLPGTRRLFEDLHAELRAQRVAKQQRVSSLLVLIYSDWWRARSQGSAALEERQVKRLLALVDGRPAHRVTPRDLAAAVNMPPGKFSRRFRAHFGSTPRAWLLQQRLERAAAYLAETGDSIQQVAELFGYDDPFFFSRQFKKVMGLSPTQWLALRR